MLIFVFRCLEMFGNLSNQRQVPLQFATPLTLTPDLHKQIVPARRAWCSAGGAMA
jgi:hypothetical protein